MTSHILVCPCREGIFSRIQGKVLVVRVRNPDDVYRAFHDVHRYDNHLHCILFHAGSPLAQVPLCEDLRNIPLALYVPDIGRFSEFVQKLPVIKQLNLRVYLPLDKEESYTNFRVLSSLGIASAIVFRERKPDWDALCDLMTYSILGRVPHAPIEPFHYIASRYDPQQRMDFGAVYFDDPSRYLHVDEYGHVALSHEELTSGKFIANDVGKIDGLCQSPAYVERLEAWRQYFLKNDGCAYCPGWRACLGKFSKIPDDHSGCKKFFMELMETIEQYQSITKNMGELWQL